MTSKKIVTQPLTVQDFFSPTQLMSISFFWPTPPNLIAGDRYKMINECKYQYQMKAIYGSFQQTYRHRHM